MTTKDIQYKKLLKNISKLPAGKTFELKDVYGKISFNNVSQKRTLGKLFKNEVVKGKVKSVQHEGKKSDNHNQYIKL